MKGLEEFTTDYRILTDNMAATGVNRGEAAIWIWSLVTSSTAMVGVRTGAKRCERVLTSANGVPGGLRVES